MCVCVRIWMKHALPSSSSRVCVFNSRLLVTHKPSVHNIKVKRAPTNPALACDNRWNLLCSLRISSRISTVKCILIWFYAIQHTVRNMCNRLIENSSCACVSAYEHVDGFVKVNCFPQRYSKFIYGLKSVWLRSGSQSSVAVTKSFPSQTERLTKCLQQQFNP